MPAPISPTRANALVTPIHRLGGFLECHCPGCGRQAHVSLTTLQFDLRHKVDDPGLLLLRDVLPRLACKRCHVPPDWVDLMDYIPFVSESMPKQTYRLRMVG